jgi:iron complex outermembrane receptor protein
MKASTFCNYNSFNPNSGRDINNLPLPSSLIDNNWFKKNLWKNTLAFNITAYQIENSNLSQQLLVKKGNINGDRT